MLVIPREGVESLKLLIMFGEMLIDRVIPREGVERDIFTTTYSAKSSLHCDPERGS